MKKTILIPLVLSLLVLISSCTTGTVIKKPFCKPPYIEYKAGECCLDQDDNKICDEDEKPKCGDEKCNGDETKCSCPQDCGECSGDVGVCHEYYCFGKDCLKRAKKNCCGNGDCETGETYGNCPSDCSDIVKISKPEKLSDFGYVDNEGTFVYSNQDLIRDDGKRYVVTIKSPLRFDGDIQDLTIDMTCSIKEEGYVVWVVKSLEDRSRNYYASYINGFKFTLHPDIWSWDTKVTMNTGTSDGRVPSAGTKILSAKKGSKAEIRYNFDLRDNSEEGTLRCISNIEWGSPKQYSQQEINIKYLG